MRFVVPGASGFVGRMLIDILINNKRDVLVIGRNKDSLSKLFRNIDVAGYDEFEGLLKQDDVIVNLAVINNNKHTSLETMRQVNVTLACTLAKAAAAAGATRFVNVSSIHALDPSQSSHYATTKRELVIALEKIQGIEITNLFLPAVHGEKFSGQLAFLNKTPQMISKAVFNIVAAAKPTADIHLVADWLNINPITSEPNVILSVSRNRGLDKFIDIWINDISKKYFKAKLHIFGIGNYNNKNKLKKYNVFFHGRVKKKILKKYYEKSVCSICLGYDETFCLNAIESMSCGTPVLSFKMTALNSLIKNGINGYKTENFKDLALKIKKIINLKLEKRKKIINRSILFSKKYKIEKIKKKWERLINQ